VAGIAHAFQTVVEIGALSPLADLVGLLDFLLVVDCFLLDVVGFLVAIDLVLCCEE